MKNLARKPLSVVPLVAAWATLTFLCVSLADPFSSPTTSVALPGHLDVLYAAPGDANYAYGPKFGDLANLTTASQATATFVVTYNGFTAEARAAFEAAVNIWANTISSPVPIRINATFTSLGAGGWGARVQLDCAQQAPARRTHSTLSR